MNVFETPNHECVLIKKSEKKKHQKKKTPTYKYYSFNIEKVENRGQK